MTTRARLLFLLYIFAVCAISAFKPLHHDESYYWTWAQHLELSYYDHPPLIAYGIRLFSIVFGNSLLAIHGFGIACWSLTGYLLYRLADMLFEDHTVSEWSLMIFLLMPMTQWEVYLSQPEAPQAVFWVLAIISVYKICDCQERSWAWLATLAGGGLMMSKYTGVMVLPPLFIYMMMFHRQEFRKPWPYLVLFGSLVLASPMLYWNWAHDFVSLKYQLTHGIKNPAGHGFRFSRGLNVLRGAFFYFSPIALLSTFYYAFEHKVTLFKNSKVALVFFPFIFVLGFHVLLGFYSTQQHRWPAPAYISGSIAVAYFLHLAQARKLYIGLIAYNLVFGIGWQIWSNLPNSMIWQHEHWYARGHLFVQDLEKKKLIDPKKVDMIIADEWLLGGQLAYGLSSHPRACLRPSAEKSQFNIWCPNITHTLRKTRDLKKIYFVGDTYNLKRIQQYFEQCTPLYSHFYKYNILISGFWAWYKPDETTMRLTAAYCTNSKNAKLPPKNRLYFE